MWSRQVWFSMIVFVVVVRWMITIFFIYPEISPKSVIALRSHNTDVVGLAMFSSETYADTMALTPAYTSMRIRDSVFLPLIVMGPWMWFNYILLTGY